MVRARRRQHLEALTQRFDEPLRGVEIVESPDTDYRYRAFIDKTTWRDIVAALVAEMDYDNFKSKASTVSDDRDYIHALHEVWSVMHGMQR